MALTDKRKIFVDEYLRTWNASEAARIAGYAHPASDGSRLLRISEISEEVRCRVDERAMSADEVLVRLGEQARASMADFVTFIPGARLPIIDLAKGNESGKFHLVKKLKYTDEGGIEFELHDAQAALFKLAQIHGLLVNRTEVTGKDGKDLPVLVIAPGMLEKLRA